LILIPPQFPLGLLMKLLNGMPAVSIADQLLYRRRGRQVTPIVLGLLGLPTGRPLPEQPANVSFSLHCHPPSAHRDELFAQPALDPLPPADGAPLAPGERGQDVVRPLLRRHPLSLRAHRKVGAHRHHIAFASCLQPHQKIGVISIVGVGDDTAMGYAPGAGLIQQGQGNLGLGLERHRRGDTGAPTALGSVCPLVGQGQAGRHGPTRLRITVATRHGHLTVAPLAQGPRILPRYPTECLPCLAKPVSSKSRRPWPNVAAAIILCTRWRVRSSSSHCMLVRNSCKRCALLPGTATASVPQFLLATSVSRPVR